MLLGVGVDLVAVNRIKKVYGKFPERFLSRLFTEREKAQFQEKGAPMASLAARFAAKEAVLKAIGCGIGPAAMREVEIFAPAGKQPEVKLSGIAAKLAEERKITAVTISLTHEAPFACAIAAAYNSSDGCS
ncbi:MAG: holo-ACP synthase [Bacillota bacterium]